MIQFPRLTHCQLRLFFTVLENGLSFLTTQNAGPGFNLIETSLKALMAQDSHIKATGKLAKALSDQHFLSLFFNCILNNLYSLHCL